VQRNNNGKVSAPLIGPDVGSFKGAEVLEDSDHNGFLRLEKG